MQPCTCLGCAACFCLYGMCGCLHGGWACNRTLCGRPVQQQGVAVRARAPHVKRCSRSLRATSVLLHLWPACLRVVLVFTSARPFVSTRVAWPPDPRDPMNRAPLSAADLVEQPELKAKVHAWIAEHRTSRGKQQAQAQGAEPMQQ